MIQKEGIPPAGSSVHKVMPWTVSKKSQLNIAVGQFSTPIPALPKDMCLEIWSYFDRSALNNASQVCKAWKNFSGPFWVNFLNESILNASLLQFSRKLHWTEHRPLWLPTKEVLQHTTLSLVPILMKKKKVDFMETYGEFVKKSDAVIFVFESAVNKKSFRVMLSIYDEFYKSKNYKDDFSCIILDPAENAQVRKSIEKMKKTYKSDFVAIESNPKQVAQEIAQEVCVERYRAEREKASLRYKCKQNKQFCKSGLIIAVLTLIMLAIFIAPGIGMLLVVLQ